MLSPLSVPRSPIVAAEFGRHALRSVDALARARFDGDAPRALLAGLAGHAMQPLTAPGTAGYGLFLGLLAHASGWPVARGGSQRLADALGAILTGLGGEIVTGHEVTALDALPPARATLLDVTPRQFLRIAGDRLTGRYRRALTRFRYGPGVFKLDWALREPIPWTSADVRQAGTVHIGGRLEEMRAAEADVHAGGHPDRPYVIVVQPTVMDPTRAPAGAHVAWGYCHVPNGSTVDCTDEVESQIERFAPGFRDIVAARHTMSARAMEAHDANSSVVTSTGARAISASCSPVRSFPFDRGRRHCPVCTSARRRPRRAVGCTACAACTRLASRSAGTADRRSRGAVSIETAAGRLPRWPGPWSHHSRGPLRAA